MFEGQFQGGDFLGRAGGKVGDGLVLDLAILAEGAAQQMPNVSFVAALGGGGVDIHAGYHKREIIFCQQNIIKYLCWLHYFRRISRIVFCYQDVGRF